MSPAIAPTSSRSTDRMELRPSQEGRTVSANVSYFPRTAASSTLERGRVVLELEILNQTLSAALQLTLNENGGACRKYSLSSRYCRRLLHWQSRRHLSVVDAMCMAIHPSAAKRRRGPDINGGRLGSLARGSSQPAQPDRHHVHLFIGISVQSVLLTLVGGKEDMVRHDANMHSHQHSQSHWHHG